MKVSSVFCAFLYMQTLMNVKKKKAMTAVRFVSTLLDHITAAVSMAFSWSTIHSVKVQTCRVTE